jgi:hypothetical protein
MRDWGKIALGTIAGAIGGFLVGVTAEPWLARRTKRKKLETSLYRELAENYQHVARGLVIFTTEKETDYERMNEHFRSGFKQERFNAVKADLFFDQINPKHLKTIQAVYSMSIAFGPHNAFPERVLSNAASITRRIETSLEDGTLNKRLFLQFLDPSFKQGVKHL